MIDVMKLPFSFCLRPEGGGGFQLSFQRCIRNSWVGPDFHCSTRLFAGSSGGEGLLMTLVWVLPAALFWVAGFSGPTSCGSCGWLGGGFVTDVSKQFGAYASILRLLASHIRLLWLYWSDTLTRVPIWRSLILTRSWNSSETNHIGLNHTLL